MAATLDLVPANGLLPPGVGATPATSLAPPEPRRETTIDLLLAGEQAATALAVQLLERDAPVAALGHPAIGQLLSARLGCRVPARFGINLAALCLR